MAIFFALRRAQHTELHLGDLSFKTEGGQIDLNVDLSTFSHALRLTATARIKADGIEYPLKLEQPIKAPNNFAFAAVNTFHLHFVGYYVERKIPPTTAFIDVKAKLSDGSRARLRRKITLQMIEKPSESTSHKGDSQT